MHIGNEREDYLYTHRFASKSLNSKGRRKALPNDGVRTEFQRDIHRIIYSQPFRRLKNKTQVFYLPNSDHICTRLEHSLQVASAARTVARALRLNEDLAEAIGLGHDLGHAPFGHHGETIFSQDIRKKFKTGKTFHHEINSLRVVDLLALLDRNHKPGLNLTYEARDGIVSHCGEAFNQRKIYPSKKRIPLENIKSRRQIKNPSTLEGCLVRLIDRVSYAGRDMEDGISAGIIDPRDIPADIRKRLGRNNGEITGNLIKDIIKNSPRDENFVALSREKFQLLRKLIDFNYKKIYKNEKVLEDKYQVSKSLCSLFGIFLDYINKSKRFKKRFSTISFPKAESFSVFQEFYKSINYSRNVPSYQIVLDFLSGFTDKYVHRVMDELHIPHPIV